MCKSKLGRWLFHPSCPDPQPDVASWGLEVASIRELLEEMLQHRAESFAQGGLWLGSNGNQATPNTVRKRLSKQGQEQQHVHM